MEESKEHKKYEKIEISNLDLHAQIYFCSQWERNFTSSLFF